LGKKVEKLILDEREYFEARQRELILFIAVLVSPAWLYV